MGFQGSSFLSPGKALGKPLTLFYGKHLIYSQTGQQLVYHQSWGYEVFH